jgi:hypothetical protein
MYNFDSVLDPEISKLYDWWVKHHKPGVSKTWKKLPKTLQFKFVEVANAIREFRTVKDVSTSPSYSYNVEAVLDAAPPILTNATEDVIQRYQTFVSECRKIKPTHTAQVLFQSISSKPIAFTCFGDLHIGSKNCQYDTLLKDLKTIKETNGFYAVSNGDIINNFIIPSLAKAGRYDMPPDIQWRVAEGLFDSIKEFMLLINSGNHEAWTQELSDVDRLEFLASSLDIPYTGRQRAGFVYFELQGVMYKVLLIHKAPSNNKLNPMYPIKNMFTNFDYDIAIAAHYHNFGAEAFIRYGLLRYASMCGTYKTPDPYTDMLALPNGLPFMPSYILFPKERKIILLTSIQECAKLLTYYRGVK